MKKEIEFFGEIGWWLDGEYLRNELDGLTANDTAVLLVHSPGGSVFEGNFMYYLIQRAAPTVEAEIVGICASMATIITSACSRVRMGRNALMMIHQPSTWGGGNAEDLEEQVKLLRKLEAMMLQNYSQRSGQSVEALRQKYFDGKDHWLTADEALAEGFIDEIIDDRASAQFVPQYAAMAKEQKAEYLKFVAFSSPSNPRKSMQTPTQTTIGDTGTQTTSQPAASAAANSAATEPVATPPAPPAPSSAAQQEVIASLNKDLERFRASVAEKEAFITAMQAEKDNILKAHADAVVGKDEQIRALTADKARLDAEKQGIAAQLDTLRQDNEINLALATITGANGKPISAELVKEIRQNFRAQHRLTAEGQEVKIFSIAKNAEVEASLAKAVIDYAYANHYVTRPQAGNGLAASTTATDQNAYDPNYVSGQEKARRIEKARMELRNAHVPEYSDAWYKAMHAVGFDSIPDEAKQRLGLA